MRIRKLAFVLAAGVLGLAPAKAQEQVEVLHWWTAGGEAAALSVLKDNLAKQGVAWKDMPVAGGSGVQAMTALRARVTAGTPPTAAQLLGFNLRDWGSQGFAANLDDVAKANDWEKLVPEPLKAFSKDAGHWVAVPVNIHSTNWLWINKAALDKAGLQPPKTLDEFIAMLDAFKGQGITALAHGGSPWQDTTLWEAVVLSIGGMDFYRKAVLQLDPAALKSDTMRKAFDTMTKLRGYFDKGFSGRDWNLSTAMVIKGEAGAQEMGDWAKGEFIGAKKTPDQDFVCIRFPGTQGNVLFNADQFMMFKLGTKDIPAQHKMAAAVLDPSFQVAFNKVKGSAPARLGVSDAEFDACGKKGIKDVAEAIAAGTMVGSLAHGYAQPDSIKNAFFDVVTQHLNGQLTTDQALTRLPAAIAAAK